MLRKPDKSCPYCGSTSLQVKEWRKFGTYFVACNDCLQAGPSKARSREEAIELFDTRAKQTEQMRMVV